MRSLTGKQRRFVQRLIEVGDERLAAIQAGYSGTSIHVEVWRLLRRPHVRAAIVDATLEAFLTDAPVARKVIRDLATDEKQPGTVRLAAARELAERSVGPVAQQINHRVVDERTDEELRARIAALAAELGWPLVIEGQATLLPDPVAVEGCSVGERVHKALNSNGFHENSNGSSNRVECDGPSGQP